MIAGIVDINSNHHWKSAQTLGLASVGAPY